MKSFNITVGNNYTVIVEPGKWITVQRDQHDPITFKIGDICEESSYNLVYTGVITGITEKSVIIDKKWGKKRRMKLADFVWRNWNFDAEKIARQNFETSQYI